MATTMDVTCAVPVVVPSPFSQKHRGRNDVRMMITRLFLVLISSSLLFFFIRKKERNGNGRIFKYEKERREGEGGLNRLWEDVNSPIPGIRIRSGRVVLRARESGASDEIRSSNGVLVFSGCLWSSRLVSGNPFPPLNMIGAMSISWTKIHPSLTI